MCLHICACHFKSILSKRVESVNDARHCIGSSHSMPTGFHRKFVSLGFPFDSHFHSIGNFFYFSRAISFTIFVFANARYARRTSVCECEYEISNDYVHSSFYAQLNLGTFYERRSQIHTQKHTALHRSDRAKPVSQSVFGIISTFISSRRTLSARNQTPIK